MKNIEYLNKKLKNFKLIRLITIIIFIPSIILIGITAPINQITATIFTFIAIPSLIIGLILDKKIKAIKNQIYETEIIKQAIEDSK